MNTPDISQENSQQSPGSETKPSEASDTSFEPERQAQGQDGFVMKTLKSPPTGGVVAGGLVLGAAAAFGVIETAVAAGAAYVVYRLLRKNSHSSDESQAQDSGESAWGGGDSDGQSR
jgi:hypothetical protein